MAVAVEIENFVADIKSTNRAVAVAMIVDDNEINKHVIEISRCAIFIAVDHIVDFTMRSFWHTTKGNAERVCIG